MTDQELADELATHYTDNPSTTVDELVELLGEPQESIVRVLDAFVCGEDRTAHHVGTGKGGGWVPVEEPVFGPDETEPEPA